MPPVRDTIAMTDIALWATLEKMNSSRKTRFGERGCPPVRWYIPHELCGITDKSTTTFCEKDAAQVFFLAEALTVSPLTLSTVTRTVKSFVKSLRLVGRDDCVPVGGVIEEAETVRLKWA